MTDRETNVAPRASIVTSAEHFDAVKRNQIACLTQG